MCLKCVINVSQVCHKSGTFDLKSKSWKTKGRKFQKTQNFFVFFEKVIVFENSKIDKIWKFVKLKIVECSKKNLKENFENLWYFVFSSSFVRRKNTKNEKISWRVWSWLRTNAGGMPNTCKSNEISFLFPKEKLQWRTGEEHVRTYLLAGDNTGKLLLIPHNAEERKGNHQKRGLRLIS